MKTILSILAVIGLCSCEFNDYVATSGGGGNSVRERNFQLGGTRSSSRSDGSSYANAYENSFKDGTNAATAIAGAYIAGGVQKVTTRNDTARAANARTPTVTPAQQVAPDTTVFPIVTQPSKPVIP